MNMAPTSMSVQSAFHGLLVAVLLWFCQNHHLNYRHCHRYVEQKIVVLEFVLCFPVRYEWHWEMKMWIWYKISMDMYDIYHNMELTRFLTEIMDNRYWSFRRSSEFSSKSSSFWHGLLNKNSYRRISQYCLHSWIRSLLLMVNSYWNGTYM